MRATCGGRYAPGQVEGFAAPQEGGNFATPLAAGRTQVDVRFALGDRLGIGPAAGKAALAALRLRQDGVDALGERSHAKSPSTSGAGHFGFAAMPSCVKARATEHAVAKASSRSARCLAGQGRVEMPRRERGGAGATAAMLGAGGRRSRRVGSASVVGREVSAMPPRRC
jgi:hypothetical protein